MERSENLKSDLSFLDLVDDFEFFFSQFEASWKKTFLTFFDLEKVVEGQISNLKSDMNFWDLVDDFVKKIGQFEASILSKMYNKTMRPFFL